MTREYSSLTNINVRRSLDLLIDRSTSTRGYEAAMFALGQELGTAILKKIHSPDAKIYLACTAEDADFLAKGFYRFVIDGAEPRVGHHEHLSGPRLPELV